ncbi:MAG: L-histidine N(alpha)-methyltransferase, partial [Thermoanaerobaculia bacterium]|nr:L-histidine N(alpha)-methyltransferase [Thermoanaerobaculia bacterium]
VVGDFGRHLDEIPEGDHRLIIFLGSTIGNFEAPAARRFLRRVAEPMLPGDFFLLGVDLIKDTRVLEAAYNDARGLTARFNRNILRVVNDRFGGDFEPAAFRHRAFFDPEREWIEMRLVSERRQRVGLAALDLSFELAPDEEILTEISTKYTRDKTESLLADGGFQLDQWWTDEREYFGLALARRFEGS